MGDDENPKLRNCSTGAVIEVNSNPFSIGRCLSSNYVIPSKIISREHCVLEKQDNKWTLRDSSTNGTFVNEVLYKKQKSLPLKNNDKISLDLLSQSFNFLIRDAGGADEISDEQLCMIADSVFRQVESPSPVREQTVTASTTTSSATAVLPPGDQSASTLPIVLVPRLTDEELSGSEPSPKKLKTHHTEVEGNNSGGSHDIVNLPGSSKETFKHPQSTETGSANAPKPVPLTTAQQDNYEVMENELMCAICSELFIKAVTLNCSHSFCKFCIDSWMKNKAICPICRTKITNVSSSIVLDNVIAKVISSSSEETKQQRKVVLEERQLVTKPKEPLKAQGGRARGGRGGRRGSSNNPSTDNHYVPPVVEISSASDTESDSFQDSTDTDNDGWRDEYDDDEWYEHMDDYYSYDEFLSDNAVRYNNGIPGVYYGGYGHCFVCGRRGHWANGCPDR